jgi:tRNA-2-methylthio-N6-dimethylallyladenosine synthase
VKITEVYTNSLRGELVRTEKDMGLRVAMTPAEMMEKTKREDELGVATFTP